VVDVRETLEPDTAEGRGRATRWALVALAVALVAFWGWAFVYQLTNQGERDMPDRLDDLSWTPAADEVCRVTADRVDRLPPAFESDSATERAAVIDAATDEYERMLTELDALAPDDGEAGRLVDEWLADYRVFLDDRRAYADALRADPTARFLVTEKYGSHITAPIDRFARVNEMEACMSPLDV
jgi:hypothetical protein